MSDRDYERAAKLVADHPDLADFAGRRDEELVQAAERALGVRFPSTYRRFLRDFGAGSFGGQEIYGVIDEDFEDSGIPDAVWATRSLRAEGAISDDLVAIYATGDGEQLCVRSGAAKEPVVAIRPGSDDEPEVVAADFGAWLREIVEDEISNAG